MELLGLDIGSKKIGVARIHTDVGIGEPLELVMVDGNESKAIQRIIDTYSSERLIIGMPMNQSGERTAQSAEVERFCSTELADLTIDTRFFEESGTSKLAQEMIDADSFRKGVSEDSVAALIILEGYYNEERANEKATS